MTANDYDVTYGGQWGDPDPSTGDNVAAGLRQAAMEDARAARVESDRAAEAEDLAENRWRMNGGSYRTHEEILADAREQAELEDRKAARREGRPEVEHRDPADLSDLRQKAKAKGRAAASETAELRRKIVASGKPAKARDARAVEQQQTPGGAMKHLWESVRGRW